MLLAPTAPVPRAHAGCARSQSFAALFRTHVYADPLSMVIAYGRPSIVAFTAMRPVAESSWNGTAIPFGVSVPGCAKVSVRFA